MHLPFLKPAPVDAAEQQQVGSYHPSIDGLVGDGRPDFALADAVLAVGRDVAAQLGRIADHLTIESVVSQSFGSTAAGNVATRDEAALRHAPLPPRTWS